MSYFRPSRHLYTAGRYKEVMKCDLGRGHWGACTSLNQEIADRIDEQLEVDMI
jgi:hypothetical protein